MSTDKLLIVKRMAALGDILVLDPLIRQLSKTYNKIWFYTCPRFVEVLENHPNIEKIITVIPDIPHELINTDRYGLPLKIDDREGYPKVLIDSYPIQEANMLHAGLPLDDTKYNIYFSDDEKKYSLPPGTWVVVDVGYMGGRQYYTHELWSKLFDYLRSIGLKIILIGHICRYTFNNVDIDRIASTTIREMFCIIKSATYFIGIESGPLHVAKCLGKRGVGLYCAYRMNAKPFSDTRIVPYLCPCSFGVEFAYSLACKTTEFDVSSIISLFNICMADITIIVTGSHGFIGSHLVDRLSEFNDTKNILLVDDNNTNYFDTSKYNHCSIKDFRHLIKSNTNFLSLKTIYHLGACSSTTETNAEYLQDNNTEYSKEIVIWNNSKALFVYASSASVYGTGKNGFNELTILESLNLYAKSKQTFDDWILTQKYTNWIGLRYFNVYGPRENHKNNMRSMIYKVYDQMKDESVQLFKSNDSNYKDGEQLRDFIYVKDTVDITLHLSGQKDGIYNVGTGNTSTWLSMIEYIKEYTKSDISINFIDIPDSLRDKYQNYTCADITKLKNTGYDKQFTSLKNGVDDTLEYITKHGTT